MYFTILNVQELIFGGVGHKVMYSAHFGIVGVSLHPPFSRQESVLGQQPYLCCRALHT
jgi:hypothetical protein